MIEKNILGNNITKNIMKKKTTIKLQFSFDLKAALKSEIPDAICVFVQSLHERCTRLYIDLFYFTLETENL